MDQHGSTSNITNPGSVYRLFIHHREYPALPPKYNWNKQKRHYCRIKTDPDMKKPLFTHKFGYVFCHRGLYERASRFIDNSNSAIDNGIRQGFFLHEVDAFMGEQINHGFLAHDQTADRVTSKKGLWEYYSLLDVLKTNLVTRGVGLQDPDFESTYLGTDDQVPDIESTLWNESIRPVGRTLQIDLRGEDFARGIAHYAFHLSKSPFENLYSEAAQYDTLALRVLGSTVLKGYNLHFNSFDHLVRVIKEKSARAYGWRNTFEFKLEHLHQLPPLIMVFYSHPVLDIARNNPPKDPLTKELSYEHIRDVFMEHVSSFINIGDRFYNFILEITHSGLGLLYDVKTGEARNPLTGDLLQDENVIFDSLVDRAMIDVSLELRRKHPNLLFSSCTRLPDVIVSDQKYKANHKTGKLVPWEKNEKGLAAQLRAIHGGLYPQSNIVVADDPIAEIAARTWIDENSKLDRRELLRIPYCEWLRRAGEDVSNAVKKLNDEFLPNKIGDPVSFGSTIPVADGTEPGSPIDTQETIRLWLEAQIFTSPDDATDPDNRDTKSENMGGEDRQDEEDVGQASSVLTNNVEHATDDTLSETWGGVAKILFGSSTDQTRAELKIWGRNYVFFATPADQQQAISNISAYKAADCGNGEALGRLISSGADINASIGFFGNALAAACARGYDNIVHLLLDNGADVNAHGEKFGCPLQLASANGYNMIVKSLLDKGADINALSGVYGTALAGACISGHDGTVELLLARGADINAPTGSSDAMLIAACQKRYENIVKLLLDRGANPNASTGVSVTALVVACANGDKNIVKLLLDKGADVNFSTKFDSALIAACRRGDENIVELLLDKGADVNGSILLYTALGAACRRGDENIVELLLKRGADVNARVGSFSPPLVTACGYGHKGIVTLLLDRGADINASGGIVGTALQAARTRGDKDIVELLLERGADANVPMKVPMKTKEEIDLSIIEDDMQSFGFMGQWSSGNKRGQSWERKIHTRMMQKRNASQGKPVIPFRPRPPSCGCFLCLMDERLFEDVVRGSLGRRKEIFFDSQESLRNQGL